MNTDYNDLRELQMSRGYAKLQALWAHEYAEIMKSIQKAGAKSSQESNWRYYAGQLKGADLMTGQLERALADMEKAGETETPASRDVEELFRKIKEESNQGEQK